MHFLPRSYKNSCENFARVVLFVTLEGSKVQTLSLKPSLHSRNCITLAGVSFSGMGCEQIMKGAAKWLICIFINHLFGTKSRSSKSQQHKQILGLRRQRSHEIVERHTLGGGGNWRSRVEVETPSGIARQLIIITVELG